MEAATMRHKLSKKFLRRANNVPTAQEPSVPKKRSVQKGKPLLLTLMGWLTESYSV